MKRLLVMSFVAAASAILVLVVLNLASRTPAQAAGTVGTGTPASCTEDALRTALNNGGTVTFNCGGPATILVMHPFTITVDTVIQGGGNITLTGGLATRLFYVPPQPAASLTVNDITLDAAFGGDGGALASYGPLSLTNVTLQNNGTVPGGCGAGIWVENVTSIIDSTFLNNSADDAGGAICTGDRGTARIQVANSTFTSNKATSATLGDGGAIYMATGILTVTNSLFQQNSAILGGSIFLAPDTGSGGGAPTVTLIGVQMNDNSAGRGGAIDVQGGTATIDDCAFTSNKASSGGGAIFTNSSSAVVTVTNATFDHNTAFSFGGGIARLNSRLDISDSSFTNNVSGGFNGSGGGLASDAPSGPDPTSVSVTSVTFSGNFAFTGGGFFNGGNAVLKNVTFKDNNFNLATDSNALTHLGNSVLANPASSSSGSSNCQLFGAPLLLDGHNLATDNTCAVEQNGTPAQLGPLQINNTDYNQTTFSLPLAGSPLIDNAANCPTLDQRGAFRPDACDIGAVEFGGLVPRLYLPTIFKNGSF